MTNEFVFVFDSTFLPGAVRISEIYRYAEFLSDRKMVRKFAAVVGSDRLESLAIREQQPYDRLSERFSLFPIL